MILVSCPSIDVAILGSALYLDQFIVWTVDHRLCDVLVHEEKKGEGKPEKHPCQNHLQIKVGGIGNVKNLVYL